MGFLKEANDPGLNLVCHCFKLGVNETFSLYEPLRYRLHIDLETLELGSLNLRRSIASLRRFHHVAWLSESNGAKRLLRQAALLRS